MKVYFVRHGETTHNAKHLHQDSKPRLSKLGLRQTQELARRFEKINIDLIVSSPFERARQTAETIAKDKNLGITFSNLFVERKRPSEIENKSTQDPEVLAIKQQIINNIHNTDWHYTDEENAADLIKRAQQAKVFLEELSAENILVATHGTIMRIIIAAMMFDNKLSTEMSWKFQKFFSNTNTGITVVEYKNEKWKLLTWNDYAHL